MTTSTKSGTLLGLPLSHREFEVLQWVSLGLTNPEIGTKLYLAPSTVKAYLGRVLEKLGAADRTHAVALAIWRGILPQSEPKSGHQAA